MLSNKGLQLRDKGDLLSWQDLGHPLGRRWSDKKWNKTQPWYLW